MTIRSWAEPDRGRASVPARSHPSAATLGATGGEATSVTTATRAHPLRDHQRAGLRAVIERDHLPGQPS